MNKLARFNSFGLEDDQTVKPQTTPVVEEKKTELEQIQIASEAISVEAFAGFDALKSAIEKVPSLLSKVTGFISNKFTKDAEVKNIYNQTTIGRISRSANYLAYSKMRVYKSVGQKVKTLKLVNVLNVGYDTVVFPFVKTELVNAERIIANLAANPHEMKSIRFSDIISKTLDANYKQNVKDLSNCFDGKDTSSQEEFGKLYDRMVDFEEVAKTLTKLNEDVYKINIDDVMGLSERLIASFNVIVKSIETKEPGFEMSANVVKALAETCYQLAAMLEYYSVYLYKLRECTVAVKDTVDCLK